MTIDEKLQHFYEVSVEEAKEDAAKAIQEHRESLSQMLEDHKTARRQSAEAEVKAEAEHVRREINKALSAEQITLKRGWSRKQEELKETLFVEVQEKLADYMATQEYQQLLISQIREIMKFAGNEEVTIYIDPADQPCLSSLTAAVNHPLTVSEYSFSGGTRAVIPGRHILIDNSFAAKFDAAKKNFTFDGGVLHE